MRSLFSMLDRSDQLAAQRLPAAPSWTSLEQLERLAQQRVYALRQLREGVRARMDARWRSERTETLEQPDQDPDEAMRILKALHYGNALAGSYRRICGLLSDVADPGDQVLELASGHGGLAIYLAQAGFVVTASEHDADLVAGLQSRVDASGAKADARLLDARCLDELEPDSVDVVLMVQAARHFSPGELAVMVASARRIARRAVVLVCGRRGLTSLGAFSSAGLLIPGAGRSFLHAARKVYSEEELRTLVTLAAQGDPVQVTRTAAGQVSLVVRSARV